METNKEKKLLAQGSHLYKFLPGDTVDLKLYFPRFAMVKVEVYEYEITDGFELKLLKDE